MIFIVLVYILLLLIFFGVSGMIVHHTIKYGYLSPSFKMVLYAFVTLSLVVIAFSLYLLLTLDTGSSSFSAPSAPASRSSDLNF